MNLSRAKTVLICTFLLLNIFLFYQLWQDQGYGGFTSFGQKEEITRLEIELRKAGLTLETNLPRSTEPVAYMKVEPWLFQPEEIINSFWKRVGGPGESLPLITRHVSRSEEKEGEKENLYTYSFGKHELVISQKGTAIIRFGFFEEDKYKNIEELEQKARQLVGSIPVLECLALDYIRPVEKGAVIVFRQEYENYPLYAGYAQVFFSNNKPESIQFYRLEVLGFAEQKRAVIPSSTALLRFLELYEKNQTGKSIVEFSLGYYSHEYDAERWEIPPVWRIRLNNGELYYINAFTGNLEI